MTDIAVTPRGWISADAFLWENIQKRGARERKEGKRNRKRQENEKRLKKRGKGPVKG
jgi:hypothetical protein